MFDCWCGWGEEKTDTDRAGRGCPAEIGNPMAELISVGVVASP